MTLPPSTGARRGALVWFRRDLRMADHTALNDALSRHDKVWGVFVYDQTILAELPAQDRRVEFIHQSVQSLQSAWQSRQPASRLITLAGDPVELLPRLAGILGVQEVITHHDDEPQALTRDRAVAQALAAQQQGWQSFKDHVIFERSEVLTQQGRPYTVFTPYKKAWLAKWQQGGAPACQPLRASHLDRLAPVPDGLGDEFRLQDLGFETTNLEALGLHGGEDAAQARWQQFLPRLAHYHERRDFPAVAGPSYLSVHLRFGTISVRQLALHAHEAAQAGSEGAAVWLSELVWRDFYHQLMHHFPHAMSRAFKPEFDRVQWAQGEQAEARWQAWCEGRTGYPLVDAAMRQLLHSGYMHNRLRMVVASFLTKDLGIDYRRGEAFFARHLNDFDLAANNGGWQWAASTGCDAQPWFRIFNPVTQSRKFDPDGAFIRRYVPELATLDDRDIHAPWEAPPMALLQAGLTLGQHYPRPIVDHALAREETLARFGILKAQD